MRPALDTRRVTRSEDGKPVGWLTVVIVVLLMGWVSLGLTIAVLPGIESTGAWPVLLAAALIGLLGAAVRPLVARLLTWIGWPGVFAGWLVCQALFVYAALSITPGIVVHDFWSAFWAGWLASVLMSIGLWVVTAGQPGVVTRHLLRANRRFRQRVVPTDVPGVIMVQIDGLSAPIARWSIGSGNVPTLSRWVGAGSHALMEWHAQLPATTPASQAGILHGASGQVPAFRWYEKDSGRLVVTNRPRDSALVESRLSDGNGLLCDGGVSVGNVFSGDAELNLLTMSTVRDRSRPTKYLATYLLDPFGFTRSLVLTVGEIIRELYQARRQRLRRVEPRIKRSGSYVLLRGATNVILRQLNLAIIAEHMMRGAPAVYCDFVDYDEIAHHAGPSRPESMASLEGIDEVLGTLEELARSAPRPYRFVVLSDHGQSQGATFLQRYEIRLEDLVRRLASAEVSAPTEVPSPAAARASTGAEPSVVAPHDDEQRGRRRNLRDGLLPKPADDDLAKPAAPGDGRPEIVVASSGNLSLVYLARMPGRVTLEEIEQHYPKLLCGLIEHPGVGWVMVRSAEHGPVVLGRAGRHLLAQRRIEGADPLAAFGPHAADDLRRHDMLDHEGDLVINSLFDPDTEAVAAFEELVGCHGGMGGWQERPVLIHPRDWPVESELVGADAVHHQLKRWLAAASTSADSH